MGIAQVAGELDREGSRVLWVLLCLSVSLVTGTLVGAAFLLPGTVGALISGRALLALGLTFVGGGLALVAVLPGSEPDRRGVGGTGSGSTGTAVEGDARPDAPAGTGPVPQRVRAIRSEIDWGVALPAVVIALLVAGGFALAPARTTWLVERLESLVLVTDRPLLHGAMFAFVLGVLWLALGASGRIRLGGPDATPEYSTPVYVAMLFSAGIAAGIVFWGPAEALFHYDSVPPFVEADARSDAAVVGALRTTLFHWGISAWSAYLVVALPVAYAVYNRGARFRVSAMLAPLLGTEVVDSRAGTVVDVLAVLATLGGLSTTLGFLATQFLTGIEFRWAVALGSTGRALFVAGITLLVVVSVTAGIGRGMRRLSVLNTAVFGAVLVGVAVAGPTLFVAEIGGRAAVGYLLEFVPMSLTVGEVSLAGDAAAEADGWLAGWTTFYWAWWLSWAPFVGLFIARISRGRRIRTVVLGAGVVTSLATLSWFVVVGGSALAVQHGGRADLLGAVFDVDAAVAGYPLFDALPFGVLLLIPFLLLVLTFFVTSADAAVRSLALLTADGDSPSVALQVALAASIGVIATALLLFGEGGLVQTAAVVTGGPFAVLGLLGVGGLIVAVRRNDQ